MRRFIVEVVVDTLILFLIGLLFSLIWVSQPFPFGTDKAQIFQPTGAGLLGYLVFSTILCLVNRGIRPILLAFTGRWLLATAGLFAIVVTWVVILITAWLAPGSLFTVAAPDYMWTLAAAALYTVGSVAIDAVLGMSRPSLDVEGRGKLVWRILDGLPTPRRNAILENLRFQQVWSTMYRYGLDIMLGDTRIGRVRAWFQRVVLGETDVFVGVTTPERVRVMLQSLGPTYVKIGQMVASRGEALPPDWLAELQKLQSDVAPFSWEEISGTVGRDSFLRRLQQRNAAPGDLVEGLLPRGNPALAAGLYKCQRRPPRKRAGRHIPSECLGSMRHARQRCRVDADHVSTLPLSRG